MNDEPSLNQALERLAAAQQTVKFTTAKDAPPDLTVADVALSWFRFLWYWRSVFFRVSFAFLLLGAIATFLIPASYTARATILPPENSGSGLSRLLTALPMAAVQMLGSSGGDSKMVELYVDIAKSQTVLTGVLDARYKGQTFRDVLRNSPDTPDWKIIESLRHSFAGSKHPRTQLVMFEMTRHDPELSAAILNQILREMEHFFQFRMATNENLQRKMIEKRLVEVSDSLRIAENQLRQFKENNRSTMLSPMLTLQEGRLMREVEINNAIYVELTRQLELAKISEAENMPVLNVLDDATPPEKRSGPSLAMIVLSALTAGFSMTVVYLRFHDRMPVRLRAILDRPLGVKASARHE